MAAEKIDVEEFLTKFPRASEGMTDGCDLLKRLNEVAREIAASLGSPNFIKTVESVCEMNDDQTKAMQSVLTGFEETKDFLVKTQDAFGA